MKGQKGRVREKKVLSMVLAIMLSMSPIASMGNVEAEETENKNVSYINEETGDLNVQEEIVEKVEDKEYVVYIEVSDETQSVADEDNGNEASKDADTADNQGSEKMLSEITVSENSEATVITNEDKTTKIGTIGNDSAKTAEEIQESIEEAEELIVKQADGQELIKDEETIIYAADLTQKEIKELEESDAAIYVEENIELVGADSKAKKKKPNNKKTDEKKSNENDHKDSDNMKEKKLAYKKSLSETQDDEPEWNIRMVNADEAVTSEAVHDETEEGTSTPVKIAVMDSGIELLAGIPVQQIVNLVPDEQDLPYYMNDMTGHGTAVAGILNDIAPDAEIYSVKIMDAENKVTLSRVVEGIYWCIENDIDIINMSFGTQTESQVFKKAIEDAHQAGILLVSSAGNGDTEGVEYPAAYEAVIAVGAVNTSAEKTEESAVGEEVELVAPGEQILSDSMLGLETVVSGTSMAAPHVTGAAAVLWQKDNTKSPEFIRGLLSQAANDLGNEEEYGNGLVDLAYALERYEEYAAEYQKVVAEESSMEHTNEAMTITQTGEETADSQEKITTPVENRIQLTEEMLIEENETPVETFEEVDYVEGRWRKKGHENLVNYANAEYDYGLSADEISFFKLGAIYPDKAFPVSDDKTGAKGNKNWHGGYSVNYVANYRFATRMAKSLGIRSQYQKAKGQDNTCFVQMSNQINITGVGIKTYENIFGENSLGDEYHKAPDRESLRRCFLYGMAAHIVTDTFCHSAFCRCGTGGAYIKVSNGHKDAKNKSLDDDISIHPKRYKDAQEAMAMVIWSYQENVMGSEIDFSPRYKDWGKKREYYLAKVLKYTQDAAVEWTSSELVEAYKAINYVP